jgi:LCP family protein required for cell wall assembly
MPRVRQRRTRQNRERLALTVLACLTGFFGVCTLVVGYVVWSLDRVERLTVAESLTAATDAPVTASDITREGEPGGAALAVEQEATGFEDLEVFRPDRPAENYLLVGSDSVEGVVDDDDILTGREAEAENHLADTVMVLRLRPDGTAAVVSIPRDLLVEISGTGRTAKINSAYNLDDERADRAARLIDTVEQNLGIDLQHFVEVDLDGFRKLVDAVGGVTVCFEQPIRDRNVDDSGNASQGGTGFVSDPGLQLLDGDEALAYVRSRHLLVLNEAGEWERLGFWNDLERNGRQQQFVFDAVDQALNDALSSPDTLRQLLGIVATNLATSNTISLFDDGIDLARLFRGFDADAQLERHALEFADVERAGLAGLGLVTSAHNDQTLDVFRGIGWNDVVESRVEVTVAGGDRSAVAVSLEALGFSTSLGAADPSLVPSDPGTVTVLYGVGGEQAAVVLASHIGAAVEFVGDDQLSGNNVLLDLGDASPEIRAEYRAVALPPTVTVAPPTEVVGTPETVPPATPSAPPPVEPIGVCS